MPDPRLGVPYHRLKKAEIVWMATHRCVHKHTYLSHPGCYSPSARRTGFFDIETSNLAADFGIILTYCIKVLGERTILSGRLRHTDLAHAMVGDEDRRVVEACVRDLSRFDIIVTYYGARFDIPYVRTRAQAMGIDFPAYGTLVHLDLYDRIKRKFRLSSNRLENACRVLLGKTRKTRIEAKYWRAGARGDDESLKWILAHNRYDVLDLEALWKATQPHGRHVETSV